jgi:hypothetical protein
MGETMTAELAIAGLIALIAGGYLAQFAFWILWPRKTEFDPYAQPHGWEERP